MSIERCLFVSERISGDETIANSLAYCQAIEKIAEAAVPTRAEYTRVVFAELERLTSHLGDLAGVCPGRRVRVCDVPVPHDARLGVRHRRRAVRKCGFLRSVMRPGGVRKDFVAGKEDKVVELLERIRRELEETASMVQSNSLFIDRLENTGILRPDIAADLNAVGPGGRASGMYFDTRKSFPYGAYKQLDFRMPEHFGGDIRCRFNTKLEECFEAIDLMIRAIRTMPAGKVLEPVVAVEPYRFAFGLTEAPRGENVHWIMTGEGNTIFRYKIRTPSFCNWPNLCHAVKGNIVPDFPLINKSFNLSYAGNDL